MITLNNVSIEFPILDDRKRSLRHVFVIDRVTRAIEDLKQIGSVGGVLTRSSSGVRVVRALDNLSFELKPGDRLGLLGHNGSGKTTLLRVLSGVFEPTIGEIDITGSVMPLMNIHEGLSPDATGLEVTRIRGYLLGLTNAEIDAMTRDVIEFCDLGEFVELPVRTYSSGMAVRLAFAIATAMTSDILLMDEVIGAGDAAFIERAQQRMRAFVDRAAIVVVATHSDSIIRQWCNRALVLEHGKMVMMGDVEEAIAHYHSLRN